MFQNKMASNPLHPLTYQTLLQNIYKRYIQVNSKQFTIGIRNRSQSGMGQVNKEYHKMETKQKN